MPRPLLLSGDSITPVFPRSWKPAPTRTVCGLPLILSFSRKGRRDARITLRAADRALPLPPSASACGCGHSKLQARQGELAGRGAGVRGLSGRGRKYRGKQVPEDAFAFIRDRKRLEFAKSPDSAKGWRSNRAVPVLHPQQGAGERAPAIDVGHHDALGRAFDQAKLDQM